VLTAERSTNVLCCCCYYVLLYHHCWPNNIHTGSSSVQASAHSYTAVTQMISDPGSGRAYRRAEALRREAVGARAARVLAALEFAHGFAGVVDIAPPVIAAARVPASTSFLHNGGRGCLCGVHACTVYVHHHRYICKKGEIVLHFFRETIISIHKYIHI
jgi:hypothetical protein